MAYILDLPRALPERSTRGGALLALGRFIARIVRNGVNEWMVKRTIDSLNTLDDRMLSDIGIHRCEIEWHVRQLTTRDW